jgi:hypothetical protein
MPCPFFRLPTVQYTITYPGKCISEVSGKVQALLISGVLILMIWGWPVCADAQDVAEAGSL